ncbi:SH3 domain-containing protein [Leptospira bourretii]|uniref:SH3 domain-containing protein n=1 Tax=Leptospira bourretii TaxID=2484962 RepID=UPI0014386BA4|nr:SH3 domain-containing protein [Leptospira bourretii]
MIVEIQFLKNLGFPLSKELELTVLPIHWERSYVERRKSYKVMIGASDYKGTSFSLEIEDNNEYLKYPKRGRIKDIYFKNGKILYINNREPIPPILEDGRSFDDSLNGINFRYNDGNLSEVACYYHFDPCDEKILLTSAGEIQKVIKEKKTCKKGCGNLIFFRAPGSYKIADNKVRVRKEPSVKSEIITELNKDTPIEVIADAEVYEEVFPHYGTWGKVKLDDGTEGYVYGAFLRAPAEPDVVAIREKAEEWKKKNGWKGK